MVQDQSQDSMVYTESQGLKMRFRFSCTLVRGADACWDGTV